MSAPATPRPPLPSFETTFGPSVLADFERASALEWLETDGTGGYASSSVAGAHTRRYHGLLVAATDPPVGRKVLLSRLDETLAVPGAGAIELASNRFPGAIHPRGHERLIQFHRCLFPRWTFEAAGVRLRKSIAMLDGEATTVVLYEVLDAPGPFTLELRPFLAGRDDHALAHAADGPRAATKFADGVLRCRFPDALPDVYVQAAGSTFAADVAWWRDFEYAREQERGFDFREDLWTPGTLKVELQPSARLAVVISTRDPAGRDPFALLRFEEARRAERLAALAGAPAFCRALAFDTGQFLVRRGVDADGEPLWTVIAGYPWFADWGRDTMIALPGLCLATRRFDEARGILRAFAASVHQGLLPNRFLDGRSSEPPEYNTVDAGLWFFVAAWRYLEATGDDTLVLGTLLPVLRDMLAWHTRGTLHGIREDADGLLLAGAGDDQLTWMDARVDGRPITPRHGKAVEIQALWINALAILAHLEGRAGQTDAAAALRRRERRARARFAELFWYADGGYLHDVVDGERRDASLRPNQILALALPFPVLDTARGQSVLAAVERALLTPRGLRTLAPDDPAYHGRYVGGPAERDAVYHQGTVWPWLLGPFLTALVRLRGDAGRQQAVEILGRFAPQLGEAGLGTVSEIFDGDAPHTPRGCIAQAWSVAELLRAALEDVGLGAVAAATPQAGAAAEPAQSTPA